MCEIQTHGSDTITKTNSRTQRLTLDHLVKTRYYLKEKGEQRRREREGWPTFSSRVGGGMRGGERRKTQCHAARTQRREVNKKDRKETEGRRER